MKGVIQRHPSVERGRAIMLQHATNLSDAMKRLEYLLRSDPDNDDAIGEVSRYMADQALCLGQIQIFYRQTRDIQGIA